MLIWVKTSVISAKDTRRRIEAVKHFLQVAKVSAIIGLLLCLNYTRSTQECYKQHNFATTLSIASALQELNIRALRVTCKRVGEKNIKAIEKLGSECRNQAGRSSTLWKSLPAVKPLNLSKVFLWKYSRILTNHPT